MPEVPSKMHIVIDTETGKILLLENVLPTMPYPKLSGDANNNIAIEQNEISYVGYGKNIEDLDRIEKGNIYLSSFWIIY